MKDTNDKFYLICYEADRKTHYEILCSLDCGLTSIEDELSSELIKEFLARRLTSHSLSALSSAKHKRHIVTIIQKPITLIAYWDKDTFIVSNVKTFNKITKSLTDSDKEEILRNRMDDIADDSFLVANYTYVGGKAYYLATYFDSLFFDKEIKAAAQEAWRNAKENQ